MLYFLKHAENDSVFYLTQKDIFYVGRKDCDLLIQNDQSISRKHALLKVQDGQVLLKDLGSKYKTTYDGSQLEPEVETVLQLKMQIKFGVYNSVYSLEKLEIVTTGTHLNTSDKKKLKNVLNIIGVNYVDNWGPKCTHLTVKEMSVTVKVLHALIDEKPIVISDYWTQFSENVLKNLPPPDIEKFNNPPVGEPILKNVNFKMKVSRKCLFKDKLFIFPLEKNKVLLEETIKKAAGQCKSWEENQTSVSSLLNSTKEILVIQVPNQEESSSYNELIQEVLKRGRRPIPLHEIALAVITGSCEKNCNPDFDRAGAVFTKAIPILPTQTGVLAESTQNECLTSGMGGNETSNIVPDTFDPSLEHVSPFKKEKQSIHSSGSSSADILSGALDEAMTSKRKNNEEIEMGREKRIKMSVKKMPVPSTSMKDEPVKMEKAAEKENSASSKSKNTDSDNTPEDMETNKISRPISRKNPFAATMKRRTEQQALPERSIKRFKAETTENTITSLQPPRKPNVFADLSKRSNSNKSSFPTETSFVNDSKLLSSTRLNIQPNRINVTKQSSNDYFSSIPWTSKSTTTTEDTPTDDLDPELKSFAESFKGKVVIEIIEPIKIFRTSRPEDESTLHQSNSSKKNFKNFKKVMPKRPQKIVLRTNESVPANSTL